MIFLSSYFHWLFIYVVNQSEYKQKAADLDLSAAF